MTFQNCARTPSTHAALIPVLPTGSPTLRIRNKSLRGNGKFNILVNRFLPSERSQSCAYLPPVPNPSSNLPRTDRAQIYRFAQQGHDAALEEALMTLPKHERLAMLNTPRVKDGTVPLHGWTENDLCFHLCFLFVLPTPSFPMFAAAVINDDEPVIRVLLMMKVCRICSLLPSD